MVLSMDIQITQKKFYSIGEVSRIANIPVHTLRYWESVFSDLRPIRKNKQRYYDKSDLDLVFRIRDLIKVKKFTTKGALMQLRDVSGL